jgi:hypothetical protein
MWVHVVKQDVPISVFCNDLWNFFVEKDLTSKVISSALWKMASAINCDYSEKIVVVQKILIVV